MTEGSTRCDGKCGCRPTRNSRVAFRPHASLARPRRVADVDPPYGSSCRRPFSPLADRLRRAGSALARSPQAGLALVILVAGAGLAIAAGSHTDPVSGATVNNFLNAHTLIQMATDASGFAIMGVGATIVIISGGIDLSVGAVYALAGVVMAMVLRAAGPLDPALTVMLGLGTCIVVSLACGLANGVMVVGLGCIRSSSRSARCGCCAASRSSRATPRASWCRRR